eukprot:SAG11_NODE_22410_length_406_cov_1.342020_1_plen_134_part_11
MAADAQQSFEAFYGQCQEDEQYRAELLSGSAPAMIFHCAVVETERDVEQLRLEMQLEGGGSSVAPSHGALPPLSPPPSPDGSDREADGAAGAVAQQQFHRICTLTSLQTCVPECTGLTYGYLLSIEIEGRGTVM